MRAGPASVSRPKPSRNLQRAVDWMASRMSGAMTRCPKPSHRPTSGRACFRTTTPRLMVLSERPLSDRLIRTATTSTTWRAMFGNGAVTGSGPIATHWMSAPKWLRIPRDHRGAPIHAAHSCRNVSSAADRFFAMIPIVAATGRALAWAAAQTLVCRTLGFAASSHPR